MYIPDQEKLVSRSRTQGENSPEDPRQKKQRAIHYLIIMRMMMMMTTAPVTSVYQEFTMCQVLFYARSI